ncbi:MAG TPA: MFS transporter [Eoetvoesiella sp.]|uniref:MFS transporter n=1 Tax=Eoetvoesiella sp. TaxID=1966355 RepID=UPI002C79D131|nr:MFS transporter [Eoetvoesiella sp.]HWK62672.1 MFS transporter [Eoetvoesiella sp.]
MSRIINVEDVIDEQKIGRFNIVLLIWLFLVLMLDGYDITAAAFAGPELVKHWGVARADLGPMLSASLFGILIGSFIFGYIGDRFGRKIGTILSCLVFGVFTVAVAWSTTLGEMATLRLLAGIGIGGIFPNAVALSAEYAPKRLRATMIILMFTGNTVGAALPGLVSMLLVPTHGFQILFLVGGIAPLVLAFCLCFALPESIKFLALDESRKKRTLQMLRRLKPDFAFDESDRFVTNEAAGSKFHIRQLFEGRFALATPLLWLLFALNLMIFYFINSWMPTLAAAADAPAGHGVLALTIFLLGGTCGGLALSRLVDKQGLRPIYIMFIVAVPVVASIGYLTVASPGLLLVAAFIAGFCVLGLQFGLNATPGLIYPTSCRANGAGWAFGVGRLGAALGPLVGGILIGMKLPIQNLYVFAALPLIVGAIACFVLDRATRQARQSSPLPLPIIETQLD